MFGFVFLTIVAPTTINHLLVCKLHLSSPKKFYFQHKLAKQLLQTHLIWVHVAHSNIHDCQSKPKQSINMINVTYVKQIIVQSHETLEARGTILSCF